jgi:hypothetical protein
MGPTREQDIEALRKNAFWASFVFSFGLPLAGILVERFYLTDLFDARNGGTGDSLFFPTPFHTGVCVAATLACTVACALTRAGRFRDGPHAPGLNTAALMTGFALGVAGPYALLKLPMTPFFVMMVPVFGLGALAFAAYWCLFAALAALSRLRRAWRWGERTDSLARRVMGGVALGLGVLLAVDLWPPAKGYLIELASKPGPSSAQAVRALRWLVSTDELLERCHHWPSPRYGGIVMQLLGPPDAGPERARAAFFRVTGRPFNAFPPPASVRAEWDGGWWADRVTDSEVGGEIVGARVENLALKTSSIEVAADTRAAVADVFWTMEVANASGAAREARVHIGLPPGAVASHLSLWVAGKEEQAAFGGRDQTRAAYQSVAVVQRRDPALLGTAGPGQVLLQVFPVPARGEARVKVGFTAPLHLDAERAMLRLPWLSERNFEVRSALKHAVRATVDGKPMERALADRELDDPTRGTLALTATREGSAWFQDKDGFTLQEITRTTRDDGPAQRYVLVVDGSASIGRAALAWRECLPPGCAAVVLAGDEVETFEGADPAAWLSTRTYSGGIDPVPALLRALKIASRAGASSVLWIHGEQAVRLTSVDPLLEALERAPRALLVPFSVSAGRNEVLAGLADADGVAVAPRVGAVADDLKRAGAGLAHAGVFPGTIRARTVVRENTQLVGGLFSPWMRRLSRPHPWPAVAGMHAAPAALAKLWAFVATEDMVRRGETGPSAIEAAVRYRLVTRVSGAVVLETKRDYEAHGLDPDKQSALPGKAVPEPELVALVLIALLALSFQARRESTTTAR